MDIGSKLKEARQKSRFTQEEIAEKLGVSRQSVSNWENNKTYPDIVSVIKLSDIYSVTLDSLLKEEKDVSNYIEFLSDSTNTVKSQKKKVKIFSVLSFTVVWIVSILFFWFVMQKGDEMAYSILVFYFALPLADLVVSLIIGLDKSWGKYRFLSALVFGLVQMLTGTLTFDLANTISYGNINPPDLTLFLIGFFVSLIGLLIGCLITKLKSKNKTKS